jgi:tetratricopeptide (TPR) repeat protein
VESPERGGALSRLGSFLLVAALALSIYVLSQDRYAAYNFTALKGESLLSDGRYSDAVAVLERLLVQNPTPAVRLRLSYGYLARRDGVRAERQARLALDSASEPQLPAIYAQLGRALAFQGKGQDALEAWTKAVAAGGASGGSEQAGAAQRSALWHSAMALWRDGRWQEAQSALERLAGGGDIYATSARVKLAQLLASSDEGRARALLAQSRSALAPRSDAIAGQASPDLNVPGLREGLSSEVITSTLRLMDEAFAESSSAPAAPAAKNALWGSVLLRQGEPYRARSLLKLAVAERPDSAPARVYYGLALRATGDTERARAELERAAALDPSLPLARQALARFLIDSGDLGAAGVQLSALKRLEPDAVQTHLLLADFYSARRQYAPAEDEYIAAAAAEKARRDGSTAPEAALSLARFYIDVRADGCEKGLPAAQDALRAAPDDPAALDAVGWALVLCGRGTDAVVPLEQAAALAPGSARVAFHAGKAYLLAGQPNEAREAFSRAMDLDPGGQWERLAITARAGIP